MAWPTLHSSLPLLLPSPTSLSRSQLGFHCGTNSKPKGNKPATGNIRISTPAGLAHLSPIGYFLSVRTTDHKSRERCIYYATRLDQLPAGAADPQFGADLLKA
jgi:hypothetical protein